MPKKTGRRVSAKRGERRVWYTVWMAATDEVVAYGWDLDCAKMMGISPNVFASTVSYVKRGRNKKYVVLKEDLQDGSYALYGGDNTGVHARTMDWSEVYDLYEQGWWDAEISRRTGRSPESIRGWRKRMGYPRNSKAEKNWYRENEEAGE